MGLFGRGRESDWSTYRMQEKAFAIGDDCWVETEDVAPDDEAGLVLAATVCIDQMSRG